MKHIILFTGHMIDAADRLTPRFPAHKETVVKKKIKNALHDIKATYGENLLGIAGGANGGDIIFHEMCDGLQIPTEMYLALPEAPYKEASVSFAGKEWDRRFDRLLNRPLHLLNPENRSHLGTVWERTNIWMLHNALSHGGTNMTLLALWDGKNGGGPGGTWHMVDVAKKEKAEISILEMTDGGCEKDRRREKTE